MFLSHHMSGTERSTRFDADASFCPPPVLNLCMSIPGTGTQPVCCQTVCTKHPSSPCSPFAGASTHHIGMLSTSLALHLARTLDLESAWTNIDSSTAGASAASSASLSSLWQCLCLCSLPTGISTARAPGQSARGLTAPAAAASASWP